MEENEKLINNLINNQDGILDEYYQEYKDNLKNAEFKKILAEFLKIIKAINEENPDYMTFDKTIEKLEKKNSHPGDYHLISGNYQIDATYSIYYVLFLEFVKAIYELNKGNQDYLLEFKLLYHYFNNKRFNNILSIFIKGAADYKVGDLTYDIDALDQSTKKERFFMAIKRHEKEAAFELLSAMDDISEKNYFKGLLYYQDGNYAKALTYLNHPSITDTSVDKVAINNLKILCSAYLGDNKTIKKLLKDNKKIDKYFYLYVKLIYLFHTSLSIAKNNFPDIKMKLVENSNYHYEFSNLVMVVLTKIYLQLEEYAVAQTIGEDIPTLTEEEFVIKVLGENNFQALIFILSLFVEDMTTLPENIKKIMNCHSLDDLKWVQNYFTDIAYSCIWPYRHLNLNWLIDYAKFLYKTGQIQEFSEFCLDGLNILIKMAENDSNREAINILGLLYEVTNKLNMPNTKLNQFITQHQIKNDNLKVSKALSNMSLKSQASLKVAEWLYQKSQEEDFGWKDASFISFAFYINIEKEFNFYLSQIFGEISYQDIKKVYDTELHSLSEEESKKYRRQWDFTINVLADLEAIYYNKETKKTNHLMLGNIHVFLLNLIKEKWQIAAVLKENFAKALAKEFTDISKIYEIMLKYTAEGMINKYRNPPAHGRYLTYDVACECREVVLNLFSVEIANLKIKKDRKD